MPALASLDNRADLPIHTTQGTIDLMRPAGFADAAEAVAAAMRSLIA